MASNSSSSQVTRSTIRREALPRGLVLDSTPLFTDHLGWIGNQTQLSAGMRNFQNRTGIRPHLYITGDIDGDWNLPTIEELSSFANRRYSELFNDEAHVLLVFFENHYGEYAMYVLLGNMARSLMNSEARDILMDFVQLHYYSDLAEEELFSRAFDQTAQRIMTVTRSPWIPVFLTLGGIIIIAILYIWWKKAKEQENLEAEQTASILSQPLDMLGDDASRLAKQYKQ
jgi:hypothetical protein